MKKLHHDAARSSQRQNDAVSSFACSGPFRGIFAALLFLTPPTLAQPIEWIGGDGNWSDPANWTSGNIPDMPTEMPILGGQSTYRVEMDFGYQFGSLSLSNPFAQLDILTGARPKLFGNLINNGLIQINPTGNFGPTSIDLWEDSVFSGTGTIRLSPVGATHGALIGSPLYQVRRRITNGEGHTIAGAGRISGPIINEGTILADGSTGSELVLSNDVLEPYTIMQSDTGLIYAKSGDIRVYGWPETIIDGGTIRTDSTARFVTDTLIHLRNVHNQATMEVFPNVSISGLVLEGNLVNDSTITMQAVGYYQPQISVPSDLHISGSGEIVLGEGEDSTNMWAASNSTISQEQGHTIRGRGTISVNDDSVFVNNGTILADHPQSALLLTGTFLGSGSYIVDDGATMTFHSGPDGVAQIEGGQFTGPGTGFSADFMIYPGYQISDITVDAFVIAMTSDIGGTIANSGTLQLNGLNTTHADTVFTGTGLVYMLSLTPGPGYSITNEAGHTFDVNGTLSGPFINRGTVTGAGILEGPFVNDGQIKATISWGALTLTGDHTQGTGSYDAGSERLSLSSCSLANATLTSEPDGRIIFADTSFESITNNAFLRSTGRLVSTISGSFTNNYILDLKGFNDQIIRFTNTMTIEGQGIIRLSDARANHQPVLVADPGQVITINPSQTISGIGKLSGSFVNQGVLEPQRTTPYSLIPSLSVNDMTLTETSIVNLDIVGLYTGSEQLRVTDTGTLTLAGILNVQYAEGIEPDTGQWTLINGEEGTEIIGDFEQINLPETPPNRRLRLQRTTNQLVLVLTCPSDINADLSLDILDVAAFINAFQAQTSEGDFNNDGVFNFFDISAFIIAFSAPCQ